jgi:hypothetical protein
MTKKNDQFSGAEAEKRLQAALRGSRVTGHKQMTDIPKKKAKPKKKPGERRDSK